MDEVGHVDPVRNKYGVSERVDGIGGGLSLTSQCGVCGAPASGYRHYAALCCYSCRSEMFILVELR